jgi:hypothetical protein
MDRWLQRYACPLPPPVSGRPDLSQLAVLVDVASLVMRFRGARGIERQQLRWVAMAAGLLAAAATVIGALTGHPALLE